MSFTPRSLDDISPVWTKAGANKPMEHPRALIFAIAALAVLTLCGLRFAALVSERHQTATVVVASAPQCDEQAQ